MDAATYNKVVARASKIYYSKLLTAKQTLPAGKTYDDVAREAYQAYEASVKQEFQANLATYYWNKPSRN